MTEKISPKLKPFIKWPGGKSRELPIILPNCSFENISIIFENHVKEAQLRIYSDKKQELSQNLDDILLYLEKDKLESLNMEQNEKVVSSVNKLYEKGYNKDSAMELVGYLKSNLDKTIDKK